MNLIKKIKKEYFVTTVFDHSNDRCPAIIKKNMMEVAAEKRTCFYCTTYVMRKQFVFLASNVITRNANNISLCE